MSMVGPISLVLDMDLVGERHVFPCGTIDVAALQVFLVEGGYGTAALTIKGTIDGTNFVSLGEPTISADGIYGPFNCRGLLAISVEVTADASSTAKASTTWLGRGCG